MSLPPKPRSSARRVDAERNRTQILAAARAAFADPDADVSMAEIARRAEVGSATLYRNFASRGDLLEALYVDEIDGICAAARTTGEDDAVEALRAWLGRFYVYFTSKRLVAAELLEHASSDAPVFGTGRARILDAGRPLVASAQATGRVRADLSIDQLLDLVAAIAKIPGDDAYREPILRTALENMAAPADVA